MPAQAGAAGWRADDGACISKGRQRVSPPLRNLMPKRAIDLRILEAGLPDQFEIVCRCDTPVHDQNRLLFIQAQFCLAFQILQNRLERLRFALITLEDPAVDRKSLASAHSRIGRPILMALR